MKLFVNTSDNTFLLFCASFSKLTTFSSFMPWNNYQGFRVYAKTVKYENIIRRKNPILILFIAIHGIRTNYPG